MDDQDYFGYITVPDNEDEENAANDLTFGDIGDIKAGDDASDALWKPDHHTLSRKIEEEKEVVQRSRFAPTSARTTRGDPFENHTPFTRSDQDAMPSDAAWNRLLKAVQGQQDMRQTENQRHNSSRPQHVSFMSSSPSDRATQPVSNAQPQVPQQMSPLMNPVEYERSMVAYYEQQTRQLLMRHKETAELQLREAIAAQNAGVVFDRAKFDEHQAAARQRILNEFYTRVNQIRYLAWLQSRQLEQHNTTIPKQGQSAMRDDRSTAFGPQAQGQERTSDNVLRHGQYGNGHAQSSINHSGPNHVSTRNGNSRVLSALHNKGESNAVHYPKTEAVDVRELERRLLEASIDKPSRTSYERNVGNTAVEGRAELRRHGKKVRRLESMTDKDQELVFRVHLRQVESAVTYKDDYYNGMYRRNEKLGIGELYSDLANSVNEMRLRNRMRGTSGRPYRSRRSKRLLQSNENQLSSSPQSNESSMNALATALGSVQTWNPKAPRRVMDFSSIERKAGKGPESKLLRDDERVKVRHEIERGYDIMASIHDIVRGESAEALEDQVLSLFQTLHIENTNEEPPDSAIVANPGLRFFGTLCVLEKGRRYLARVLDILDISERIRVIPSVFESLGAMVYSLQRSRRSAPSMDDDIVSKSLQTISDSHTSAFDCITMLSSFSSTHSGRPDAFLTTFRSASGAKLMYCCMQRISRGLYKKEIDEQDVNRAGVAKLAKVFTEMLQRMFDEAELVNRVWEVTASFDSILSGEPRSVLRAELNRLLRSGAAPPPPEG
ncbi:Pat1-like protein [Gracilaria domingensis]|nr:Pat1-like protein [Gracilaria domingensis]